MGKTAYFMHRLHGGWHGEARLYRLSEPMTNAYEGEEPTSFNHVVVSTSSKVRLETYIFPSDDEGNILNWLEQEGSFINYLDHEKALNNVGYEVVSEAEMEGEFFIVTTHRLESCRLELQERLRGGLWKIMVNSPFGDSGIEKTIEVTTNNVVAWSIFHSCVKAMTFIEEESFKLYN